MANKKKEDRLPNLQLTMNISKRFLLEFCSEIYLKNKINKERKKQQNIDGSIE